MSDKLFYEALENVEQKLSKPRNLIIHTLLFSFGAPLLGIMNTTPYVANQIDGRAYWAIFLWCLALVGHGVMKLRNSGAWKSRREEVIRYTLLEMAHTYELSTEELVQLHRKLDEELRHRTSIIRKPLAAVIGHSALWQGTLLLALLFNIDQPYNDSFTVLVQVMPIFGSLLIGIGLSLLLGLGLLKRQGTVHNDEYLNSLYAAKVEKPKRKSHDRLAIDDEGEIVLEDEFVVQRKRG